MATELSEVKALIVGASRGSGRAIALELGRLEATLALMARGQDDLQAALRLVEATGATAIVVAADASVEAQAAEAVEQAAARLGGLNVLVYCAGMAVSGPVESYSLEDWRATLDANLTGLFLCARAVIPHLKAAGGGHIIALSSGAGKQGYAGLAAYCASKFGLGGFMASLGAEVGELGIKTTTLVPGGILTDFGGRSAEARRGSGGKYLLPEDVAQAVAYLLSQSDRAWTEEMNLWPFR